MPMPKIITTKIDRAELKRHVEEIFGDMAKFVVDVEKGILGLGGEMHAE